ncbi:MAG: hypothetical protein AB8B96_01690 [Lysobacterales bacterium]
MSSTSLYMLALPSANAELNLTPFSVANTFDFGECRRQLAS